MPKRALTAASVERIKPPAKGQIDHFDKGYPGLALRVSYGGGRSWVYFYRLHGKLHRMTLGRWPSMQLADARAAWQDARRKVSKGETPAPLKDTPKDDFESVADEWLKRDQAHKRSYAEVKRVIDRDVKPAWHEREISGIGRREVLELLDGIADRGAVTLARRLHAHLHRLFRWSVGRGIIEANPMTDMPKPGQAVHRDRVLSDAELAQVWGAANDAGWPFGPALQLLILTAARREQITALCWTELQRDQIRLEGARTKNGDPHFIPLPAPALAIIKELPRVANSDLVFTTTGETPISGWSRAKENLDKSIAEQNGGAPLPDWRLHDLRRTAATGMQRLGVGLQVVEAVLGHTSGSRAGVVGIYQRHSYDTEKRSALEAWAQHVITVVNGKGSNAVPMSRGT